MTGEDSTWHPGWGSAQTEVTAQAVYNMNVAAVLELLNVLHILCLLWLSLAKLYISSEGILQNLDWAFRAVVALFDFVCCQLAHFDSGFHVIRCHPFQMKVFLPIKENGFIHEHTSELWIQIWFHYHYWAQLIQQITEAKCTVRFLQLIIRDRDEKAHHHFPCRYNLIHLTKISHKKVKLISLRSSYKYPEDWNKQMHYSSISTCLTTHHSNMHV